ncbi:MAG: DUF309 domain-containing protein [Planctomycetales bacterium]
MEIDQEIGNNEKMSELEQHDQRYIEGIKCFNECEFFEAHDIWEELWADYRGPSREFYQGLIQVAVALYHFGNGNIRGARKLYVSSRNHLQSYRPKHLDCDLELLFAEMEECFSEVLVSSEEFPRIDLDPEMLPEIHLKSSSAANDPVGPS